jgi:NAD(P)-dependent dehydrogenase (short-subunit alcohol dehydrogenase family)
MTTIKELMDLRGRRALITGATGVLGSIITATLAELGAELLLLDRPGTDFYGLLKKVEGWPVKTTTLFCDLECERDRQNIISHIKNDGCELSILVNNAAFVGASELSGWAVPFELQSIETWRRALEVNLTSTFEFCQGLAPILKRSPGASIINIASIYGILGPDWRLYSDTSMSNPAAYAVSKGGALQLTRWLSTTLAPDVRVNSISPGGIRREQPKEFVERYQSRTPLGRMAVPDDFSGAIAFLASDQAKYVTGQNMVIDGGWSAW